MIRQECLMTYQYCFSRAGHAVVRSCAARQAPPVHHHLFCCEACLCMVLLYVLFGCPTV